MKSPHLLFYLLQFIWIHDEGHGHINVPHEVNSEADCTVDDHTVTYLPCRKKNK